MAAAFAELAETFASDLDIETYLAVVCRHCVELIDVSSAVIVYATPHGRSSFGVASSDEAGRRLAADPQGARTGPWSQCMATGQLIPVADLDAEGDRWPGFRKAALRDGLTAVTMIPINARGYVVGALALLGDTAVDAAGIHLACSLADAAGTGILLADELRRRETAINQLQTALTSRIVIEQAKGILAERWQMPPDEAFEHLRRHARRTQCRLPDLARAIVDGSVDVTPSKACSPLSRPCPA